MRRRMMYIPYVPHMHAKLESEIFCFQILHVQRAHMKYYHTSLNLAQVCEKKVKTTILRCPGLVFVFWQLINCSFEYEIENLHEDK